MPMYVTPEEIAKAREIDAFSYLQAYDPGELVKCGHNGFGGRKASVAYLRWTILSRSRAWIL